VATEPTRIAPPPPPAAHPAQRSCDTIPGAAEQARCLRSAVEAADRDLRRAYAEAVDAGVEPSIMNHYRKRWSKLRKRSSDEPAYLIGSYGALTEDLYILTRETRAASRGH
jgi:uncharacterized protein YecT (DUF1311 family)